MLVVIVVPLRWVILVTSDMLDPVLVSVLSACLPSPPSPWLPGLAPQAGWLAGWLAGCLAGCLLLLLAADARDDYSVLLQL